MNRTAIAALALACALSTPAHAASDGTEPDPVLTPGADEAPPMAKKAKRKPRAPLA